MYSIFHIIEIILFSDFTLTDTRYLVEKFVYIVASSLLTTGKEVERSLLFSYLFLEKALKVLEKPLKKL